MQGFDQQEEKDKAYDYGKLLIFTLILILILLFSGTFIHERFL